MQPCRRRSVTPFQPSAAPIGDAPDRPRAVLAHEKRAVLGHCDADWTAPDIVVPRHETGDEVLIFAGRPTVLEEKAHDLVARPRAAIPGAVQRDEGIAPVVGREARALVEGDT